MKPRHESQISQGGAAVTKLKLQSVYTAATPSSERREKHLFSLRIRIPSLCGAKKIQWLENARGKTTNSDLVVRSPATEPTEPFDKLRVLSLPKRQASVIGSVHSGSDLSARCDKRIFTENAIYAG